MILINFLVQARFLGRDNFVHNVAVTARGRCRAEGACGIVLSATTGAEHTAEAPVRERTGRDSALASRVT